MCIYHCKAKSWCYLIGRCVWTSFERSNGWQVTLTGATGHYWVGEELVHWLFPYLWGALAALMTAWLSTGLIICNQSCRMRRWDPSLCTRTHHIDMEFLAPSVKTKSSYVKKCDKYDFGLTGLGLAHSWRRAWVCGSSRAPRRWPMAFNNYDNDALSQSIPSSTNGYVGILRVNQ